MLLATGAGAIHFSELLLAQAVGAVDLVLDGHLEELADVEIFQIG